MWVLGTGVDILGPVESGGRLEDQGAYCQLASKPRGHERIAGAGFEGLFILGSLQPFSRGLRSSPPGGVFCSPLGLPALGHQGAQLHHDVQGPELQQWRSFK